MAVALVGVEVQTSAVGVGAVAHGNVVPAKHKLRKKCGELAEFKASAYMRMRPGRWLFNLRVTAILRALLGSASMHTLLKPFAAAASEMPPRLQPTSNNSPKLEVSSEQSPRAHTARRRSANEAM